MLVASFIPLVLFVGVALVEASDECAQIAQCNTLLQTRKGETRSTIKFSTPDEDDVTSLCAKSGFLGCMDRIMDPSLCSDTDLTDDAHLNLKILELTCFDFKTFLGITECSSYPYSQKALSKSVREHCEALVEATQEDFITDDDKHKCMMAKVLMRCVADSIGQVCGTEFQSFYSELSTLLHNERRPDCAKYYRTAVKVYENVISRVPSAAASGNDS